LGSGLTQNPFFLPTTSYLAFLDSHPLFFAPSFRHPLQTGGD
jgi:hypothetical protein